MSPPVSATPALCIDLPRVDRNLARVATYAAAHGLAWRPHVKTHKSPEIARRQVAAGAVGVACATPRELEVMAAVTEDLLLAFPPVGPGRVEALVAHARTHRVGVLLDASEAVERLGAAADAAGVTVRVLVEVDAGMHRTGVSDVTAAIALAERVARQRGLALDGFGFYPGHLRQAGPEVDLDVRGLSALVAEVLDHAARAGLPVATVSGGSTPLLWRSHEITGMTELRAGTAAYFDRTSVLGGVCGWDDCAATVRATVVSTAVAGQAVVDAGVKAVGREPMRGVEAAGYACVAGRPEVPLVRLSEEHGILDLSTTDWRPGLGEQVDLVPNHACVAVHNFDVMYLHHPDGREERLPIRARGR